MTKRIAIGVDIGGHHIACAAIDINKNEVIANTDADENVNNKASAEEILGIWTKAIKATLAKIDSSELAGIGFAMPGPFDYAKGIALFTKDVQKFENLHGLDIAASLRKSLSLGDDIRFRFINDATAFGIAETWIGKAKNDNKTVVLTLGTGFGSAFFDNGLPVLEGENVAKSGCLWHIPFNGGIADDSFSTRWFENNYLQRSGRKISGVKGISIEAKKTDAIAQKLFKEYGTNLGVFLAPWLKQFDAQSLVIGGNIIGSFDLFGQELNSKLTLNKLTTKVYLSELMETAAIVGAARLIDDNYYEKVKDLLTKM
ncbi:MAG: ROK family protein [Bacteroidetes bacterium]|nr:ROK family protein [Bacteroidota bacterium]